MKNHGNNTILAQISECIRQNIGNLIGLHHAGRKEKTGTNQIIIGDAGHKLIKLKLLK